MFEEAEERLHHVAGMLAAMAATALPQHACCPNNVTLWHASQPHASSSTACVRGPAWQGAWGQVCFSTHRSFLFWSKFESLITHKYGVHYGYKFSSLVVHRKSPTTGGCPYSCAKAWSGDQSPDKPATLCSS